MTGAVIHVWAVFKMHRFSSYERGRFAFRRRRDRQSYKKNFLKTNRAGFFLTDCSHFSGHSEKKLIYNRWNHKKKKNYFKLRLCYIKLDAVANKIVPTFLRLYTISKIYTQYLILRGFFFLSYHHYRTTMTVIKRDGDGWILPPPPLFVDL